MKVTSAVAAPDVQNEGTSCGQEDRRCPHTCMVDFKIQYTRSTDVEHRSSANARAIGTIS